VRSAGSVRARISQRRSYPPSQSGCAVPPSASRPLDLRPGAFLAAQRKGSPAIPARLASRIVKRTSATPLATPVIRHLQDHAFHKASFLGACRRLERRVGDGGSPALPLYVRMPVARGPGLAILNFRS
jgi:hypothetical protein